MSGKIFINYRREDDPGYTGWLRQLLREAFSADQLFMDVDSIPLGLDFVRVLEEEVDKCDVVLAIIGPRWLETSSDDGKPRLDLGIVIIARHKRRPPRSKTRRKHAMPSQDDAVNAWCKEQQVLLLQIADRLESGAMVTGEKQPNGEVIDTSTDTLAQVKSSLASLQHLLPQG
jgi:hypothetical protein